MYDDILEKEDKKIIITVEKIQLKAKNRKIKKGFTLVDGFPKPILDCKCDRCKKPNAITYHQRTMYEREEDNWVTLCETCKEKNDEYWDSMWDEYYKGCL